MVKLIRALAKTLWLVTVVTRLLQKSIRMYNHIVRFEWDDEKANSNEGEHSISFIEAATVFDDNLAVALPDPDHSIDEFRFLLLGESSSRRLLVVSYTERDDVIRIISARSPTRKEPQDYENSQ